MNRKGFTLIELLAVIVLITVITLVAVPSIRYASKKIQEKNYDAKLKMIKASAEDYGNDYKEIIQYNSSTTYTDPNDHQTYPSVEVHVSDLLANGYLVKDADIDRDDILDPRDDSSLKNKSITIYIKNNNAYAVLNFN